MFNLYYSSRFKKDYKRMIKRGVNAKDFEKVVNMLVCESVLPEKYKGRILSARSASPQNTVGPDANVAISD